MSQIFGYVLVDRCIRSFRSALECTSQSAINDAARNVNIIEDRSEKSESQKVRKSEVESKYKTLFALCGTISNVVSKCTECQRFVCSNRLRFR